MKLRRVIPILLAIVICLTAAAEAVVSQVSAVEAERMENQIQLWETAKEFIN